MLMTILTLAGALGMFLYGMSLMSTGLQKAAGTGLRKLLASITSNPFKGVLTGLGVTAAIQSSSATTVMVVGFVNAGLLTLTQAIGVIMGANIGTTMTAWIIAVFGFKADISALAVPLMALGFIFSVSKKDKLRNIRVFLLGHNTASGAVCIIHFHKLVFIAVPDNHFLGKTAKMHHNRGKCRQKFNDIIPVGHSVHTV